MKELFKKIYRQLNRSLRSSKKYDFRKPLDKIYGLSRGKPIDRFYIENFLKENKHLIQGICLEVARDEYTTKIGGENVKKLIFSM